MAAPYAVRFANPWPGRVRLAALALAAATTLTGCVADELENRRDPYGSSRGGFCYPSGGPCPVVFTHPFSWPPAQSVVLFGDYKPDGWDVGVPLQVDGRQWRTEVSIMPGVEVRYRFLIDDTQWVTDPHNPVTEPWGEGEEVSVMSAQCSIGPCGG